MKPIRRSLMVFAVAASMAACGDTPATTNDAGTGSDVGTSTGTDAGTGAEGGTVTDAGGGGGSDVPAGPITISGVFGDGSMPVADATVEVVGATPANSTMTNATGNWSLTLPASSAVFIRASKAGFRSVQSGVTVPAGGIRGFNLTAVPSNLPAQVFTATGITENTAAGIIVANFFLPRTDAGMLPGGFGAGLSAGGGTRVALGNGPPTVRDTTVGEEEQTLLIINVAAGMTTVTPTAPAGFTCTPSPGALTTIRVDPQVLSFIDFNCR